MARVHSITPGIVAHANVLMKETCLLFIQDSAVVVHMYFSNILICHCP